MSEIEALFEHLNSIITGSEITLSRQDNNLPVHLKTVMEKIYGAADNVILNDAALSIEEADETIFLSGTCPSVFCEEIIDQTVIQITIEGYKGGSGWGLKRETLWKNTYEGGGGQVQWLNRWPAFPTMQLAEGMFTYGAPAFAGSIVAGYEAAASSQLQWKDTGYWADVTLDMANTELFQKYSYFFGGRSLMTFRAVLPLDAWRKGRLTAAFISEPFETHLSFPVFSTEEGEPAPLMSAEMRVFIKTAVYDQLSVANWADADAENLISAALFVFELEEPASHGFRTLTMEAFCDDVSGCVDFYGENYRSQDMSLVTELLGPKLAVEVENEIGKTGEILPGAIRLLNLRDAVKVCNLTFRFVLGEEPGAFIRQSLFMDLRLEGRGERMFAGITRYVNVNMDLINLFFHIEVVFLEEEPGAAVCCSVRTLAELKERGTLFYDSSEGDYFFELTKKCSLSSFGFPEPEFTSLKADNGSEDGEENREDAGLWVENFQLQGNFRTLNVYASLALAMDNFLKLSIGNLQLVMKEITAYISIQEQDMGFGIAGLSEITLTGEEREKLLTAGTDCFGLLIGGTYDQSQWSMYASLAYGAVSLAGLVRRIAGIQIPEGYDLRITKLSVSFHSEKGYQAVCELDGTIPVLDTELKAGAEVSEIRPRPLKVQLYGQLSICGFLFTAKIQLSEGSARLFFELTFDGADLIAEAEGNKVIVTIKEISVGALIRAFYRIIRPNVDYSLPDPFSLLNRVGLSDIVITFDREGKTVTVIRELNINLLAVRITGIGFRYVWGEKDPDKDRFEIILRTDENSGERLTENDSLQSTGEGPFYGYLWDALHDNAPVLFEGGEVFALHYFALGRNVLLGQVNKDGRLKDILSQLRKNLSDLGAGYNPETGWMICADFTIAKCFSLCILIYDPWIYGAEVTVESDTAIGLKGLDLTLYYRKVTEAVGLFYLCAQLPDAIRKVDLGGFSFTLPVIEVWLYTNGDFRVNLGFPKNRDFSCSFAFSYGIYSGSGGLYFGRLSGDTSGKVPAIVNGYFTPVTEIGIGLKFAVGKALNLGILKLAARLELTGIFEGVFAFFRPKDQRQEEALYYKCSALVEVSAELSGTVDFFVIKAGFHIYAGVQVLVTLEAHEPAVVEFEAELSVKAYLKILFITVHFSFSFTYKDVFILGEKSEAPWVLEEADVLPVRAMAQVLEAGKRNRPGESAWDKRPPFEAPEALTCLVTPYFTAKQILLKEKEEEHNRQQMSREEQISWQTAVLTILSEESFVSFVKGLARRAFYAASGGKDSVTLGQLYGLLETLEEARETVFQMEVLERFLQSAFSAVLCVPDRAAWNGQMENGAVMPFFPQLVLTWYISEGEQLVPAKQVELISNHPLSDDQIADIRAYFAHFEPEAEGLQGKEERPDEREKEVKARGACAIIFEDYCFMLTRQCVLDVVHKLEEDAGAVSLKGAGEELLREYSVVQLSEELFFEQYRGMSNRFLLGGARLPFSSEKEGENSAVFLPLYGLMGVMFDSASEEESAKAASETVHRLLVTKNPACACDWIHFAYGRYQDERLYVMRAEEKEGTEEEELVLDILKGELEYPDKELSIAFARRPAQTLSVRQEKIPLSLRAGRKLYYDGKEAEIWQLPLSMAEMGEDIKLGFTARGNLAEGIRNTADFLLGVALPFEISREENHFNCVLVKKVPEETLSLLLKVKEYSWNRAALLFPSPVQDNHGTDPVTDSVRNQALSFLRCNLSPKAVPAGDRNRKEGERSVLPMNTLASIGDLPAFLTLLFEMGQAGGNGHFMIFGENPPDASYYEDDGTCRVELLLTCGADQRMDCINALIFQRPEETGGEPLLCGEGIPGRPVTVMKQGVTGFSFSLKDPDFETGITEKEKRTRQAFSLLNYRKEEDPVLGGAYDSMPVSMQAGAEGEWEYRAGLAVYRFGEETADGSLPPSRENPYQGVLTPGKLELSLFFTDVCGNPAFGADGGGLPVSLELLYTDELIGVSAWPDTSCSYQVASGENGKLLFRFLLDFGDEETKQKLMAKEGGEGRPDKERCALIYYQLHQPDTGLAFRFTLSGEEEIRPEEGLLTALRSYSIQLYEYACGGSMPEGIRYEMELPAAPASRLPRLVQAQLSLSRDESRVQKNAPLPMGSRAVSELPPYRDFELFCGELEKALCGEKFCVKLARGAEGLYAVYFGEDGCQLKAGIEETARGLFAQRPVSLKLLNREKVEIIHLDGTREVRSFYGVDIDLWASGFLADFENMLSAARLEKLVSDGEILKILGALASLKGGFAQTVPERVSGIFDEADQALIKPVKDALCVELAEELSRYSRISGIMAYAQEDREDTANFVLSSQRADVKLQKIESGRAVVVFAVPEYRKALKQVELSGTDAVFTHAELPGKGWFSFVRPFSKPEPYGQVMLEKDKKGNPVSVPVILREYPEIPVLMGHQGKMDEGAGLSSFTWSYQARAKLKPAAQDRIYVSLILNGEGLTAAKNAEKDLFGVLAGYYTVREEIMAALEEPSLRKKALEYFYELASDALTHWNDEPVRRNSLHETLVLQAVYEEERIVRYVVQWMGGRQFSGGFPVLAVTDSEGNRAVMKAKEEPGGSAVYSLEEFPQVLVDFEKEAEYELLFEKLPLEKLQSMSIQVGSTRNEAFFLPGYGEKETAPEFVYRTENVSFPQQVSPFGSYEERIAMGLFSKERFCALFKEISKSCELQFAVFLEQILYEAVNPPVTADFPICFGVKKSMGQEELLQLYEETETWLKELPQRSDREQIRVSVQCYSKELREERLLLEWKNLIFTLK